MSQPQGINLAVIMPAPGIVVCPYLPPIPQMSKVTGAVIALQPLPCLGDQCAIFDGCQGKYSPRAAERKRLSDRIGYLNSLSSLAEKGKSLPWIGMSMEGVIEFISVQLAKTTNDLAAIPEVSKHSPLPSSPSPEATN
jgi:hypothetical protein